MFVGFVKFLLVVKNILRKIGLMLPQVSLVIVARRKLTFAPISPVKVERVSAQRKDITVNVHRESLVVVVRYVRAIMYRAMKMQSALI